MSWFFLATSLGKEGKTSDSAAFKSLQNDIIQSGGKQLGNIMVVKLDKSKFKIGTLDQLVKLNDALTKVDYSLDGGLRKIQKQVSEISEDMKLKIETNDAVYEIPEYIEQFQWDDSKYPRSRSLVDIASSISEKHVSIDVEMKKFIDEYNQLKVQLAQYKKKEDGSFQSRDLGDIIYGKVDSASFVHDSKFLRNVIIVVPKSKIEHFNSHYEEVKEGVVPRSARDLGLEDKEGNRLIRVVVMEASAESFLTKCKQKTGFNAKLFIYNEEKYKEELQEAKVLEGKLNVATGKLEKKCYHNFYDLYIASMHLKVMRAFIDGVLRFGIPPKFLLTVVKAKLGSEKKIIKSLIDFFASAKEKDLYGSKEEIGDTEDFYPFVFVPISVVE
mmetsp:Transcript_16651/g.19262  ORF Transcript_16651/g.19262 Transcript_16651/m.19262 type:complete len:385 (-) Transcript_16651:21-1175(-)